MGIRTGGYTDEDRKKGRQGGGGGGPYPPEGPWRATVDDAYKAEVGKDDLPVWKMVFNVDGPDRTVERKHTIFLDNEGQLANLVESLGQRSDPDEIEPDDVIGRRCRVVIKHKKSWKKDDDRKFAEIDYLLPAEGGAPSEEKRRESRGRDRDDRRNDRGGRDRARGRDDRDRDRDRGGRGKTYGDGDTDRIPF